ncbi:MAG: amino acid ABC transporter permease [Clostridia bacterium]|nr:amino acid ABC transporter permease [Clostridia bacterium]
MLIGCIIAVVSVMPKYPVLPYAMQSRFDRFLDRFPKKPLLRVVTLYYVFFAIMWILQRTPVILQKICSLYVALFRGTPVMVQLLLGYFVLIPSMGFKATAVQASIIIFGLNSGAYVSEIMRGGINSVDSGQLEAARAVGFSYASSMIKIVVPQAIKNILPTLGNEFIALIKETSIIGYAGALDLVYAFKQIGTSTYEYTVPYIVLSVIYIALVVIITIGLKIMERWLAKSDRRR